MYIATVLTTGHSIYQPFSGLILKVKPSTFWDDTTYLQSCTSDHHPAAATTFLHQQIPVLHKWLPSCTSSYLYAPTTTFLQQQLPFLHQRLPPCSSNDLPSLAASSPAPATTFLHRQLLFCTSDYLPTPAATSPTTAATSSATVTTSSDYQTCTSNPVLHRRLVPAPTTSSWILQFPITIRHNKIYPFKTTTLFYHSCLVCCQPLII